jgi:hypothetical protein
MRILTFTTEYMVLHKTPVRLAAQSAERRSIPPRQKADACRQISSGVQFSAPARAPSRRGCHSPELPLGTP